MTIELAELPGTDPRRSVDWQARARCTETDPELFFPERGGDTAEDAKRFCRMCEVRRDCLTYALARPGTDGIWGGTSFRQRQRIRAAAGLPDEPEPPARELQPCGTEAAYARHLRHDEPVDDACREAATRRNRERDTDRAAANARRREQYAAGKCEKCHYRRTSDNHRVLCGRES